MANTPPLPDDWEDNPEWDDTNARPLLDGEKLVAARVQLGLSQKAMADLIGVSIATLRNWEQRRCEPEGPGRALIRLLYQHPIEIRDWLTAA